MVRSGRVGFCRAHRDEAVRLEKRYQARHEAISRECEHLRNKQDDRDIRKMKWGGKYPTLYGLRREAR